MQKNSDFLGRIELLSKKEVTASFPTTVHLRYTAGIYGVDENGGVRLAWRTVSDWEQPQFNDPTAFGYTTVQTNAKIKMEISRSPFQRPFHNSILIKVRDGNLFPGETIDIILGDTRQGSPGIRAQSFVETEHEFKFLVDPFNVGTFRQVPESAYVSVVNGPANEVQMVAPSTVKCGEAFACTVRVLDEWGNPCKNFEGDISVTNPETNEERILHLTRENKGFLRFEDNVFLTPATYQYSVRCGDFSCLSNPTLVSAEDEEYHLYWGDMHGQTSFTVGTGSMDEYYSFAEGPAALDFTGWQGNDFEVTKEKWDAVRDRTEAYNKEGKFLTYLGYEWSGNFPGGGDHNVWFLHDTDEFYPSSYWSTDHDYAPDKRCDRYPVNKLFDTFRGREDVLIIPHIGGRPANLDYYDKEFTRNIEIHSHHGTFEWFAHDAMARKLKVSFVASSDDHTCRPGLSYALQNTGQEGNAFDVKSGLMGVYAKELTKEAIWEAIKARRVYAVTFDRIILDVRVNGARMGEEIKTSTAPIISVKAHGDVPFDHVDVFRGNTLVHRKVFETKPRPDGKMRVRFMWSGVRTIGRKKSSVWNGSLFLDKGRICDTEEVGFDTFQQGVTYHSNQMVSWKSSTSGDYDGIIFDIDPEDGATLSFRTKLASFDIPVAELTTEPKIIEAGGVNLQVEIALVGEPEECNKTVDFVYTDEGFQEGFGAYWVKAVLVNGQKAFSSPVFVNE